MFLRPLNPVTMVCDSVHALGCRVAHALSASGVERVSAWHLPLWGELGRTR